MHNYELHLSAGERRGELELVLLIPELALFYSDGSFTDLDPKGLNPTPCGKLALRGPSFDLLEACHLHLMVMSALSISYDPTALICYQMISIVLRVVLSRDIWNACYHHAHHPDPNAISCTYANQI